MQQTRIIISFFIENAFVCLLYIGATKIGFALAFFNSQVSPIWPPEGVALAALLLRGRQVLVGVFLGAIIGNFLALPNLSVCLGIGFANTLGVLINVFLVTSVISRHNALFDKVLTVILYVFLCIPFGSATSATIGVGSLYFGEYVPTGAFWRTWATWWSGEMQGYLIVAPLLLIWSKMPKFEWSIPLVTEGLLLIAGLAITGLIVFTSDYPLAYIPIFFLVWAAFRFREHGSILAITVLSAIAVFLTTRGNGPFVVREGGGLLLNESLILLQVYLAIITIMTLLLSATVIERAKARLALEKQRNAFYRFVPVQFLKALGKDDAVGISLGDNSSTTISVLFTDIRSFTSHSETMSPEETFQFLNSFFEVIEPEIKKCGGFVDKFVGDAIMALFEDTPGSSLSSADKAVNAAIMMQRKLRQFNSDRSKAGSWEVRIGVGINTGRCMLGTVGSQERMDTTVIGDTVNLAFRLEGLTKKFDSPIIISRTTRNALKKPDHYDIREIGTVSVKGKAKTVAVYKVMDRPESSDVH